MTTPPSSNGVSAESIRILRDPVVYLVGRQQVDQGVVDRFLGDHGAAWQTDTEVGGEHLAEIAGRLCYMSYAKPRPGGNKTYINHILEVGHGSVLEHAVWNLIFTGVSRSLTHELVRHRSGWGYCLTGDTLVYSEHLDKGRRNGTKKRSLRHLFEMTQTPHGRSRLKLLRLRCLDEQTNTFVKGRVKKVVSSGRKPVFRMELEDGKSISCSRDHRFLTPEGWLPLHEIVGGLNVSPGDLALYGRLDIPLATNGVPAYKDRDWLRARYHDEAREQEEIAQLAEVSPHTIRAWVRKHGLQKPAGSWTVGRVPWNKAKRYKAGWRHSEEVKRILSEAKKGALNPQWKGGVSRIAVQIRRPVKALIPALLARHDYTCRLCKERGGMLTAHHVLPVWARPDLICDPDNLVPLCEPCHLKVNHHELDYAEQLGGSPDEVRRIDPAGRPCGGGNVLVPRFQRIASVTYAGEQETFDIEMEGPNHNFVANGFVTHNSQLSQRYVDESVAEYVEPDVIADDPALHALWLEAIGHVHHAYVKLVEGLNEKFADEPDRTQRRKMARQAARSVLPNATETKIFVTANARALRHFIEMRGSRHAEVEIRKLAIAVLRLMQQEAPNLFSDYQLEPLPDGTFEATTAYRKV
jgi:thymidylate synthase (FAD)